MPKIIGNDDQINFISGSLSNDRIYGGNQTDFISGGGGDDFIHGGFGSDFLNGGDGNDKLLGGAGDDRLFGGTGNDILKGGEGNDVLQGEDGDDKLVLGDGDIANGGNDADTFVWKVEADETISISDFDASEGDVMRLWGAGRLEWEAIEESNHTVIAFENGAEVKFFGYSASEIEANASEFGL